MGYLEHVIRGGTRVNEEHAEQFCTALKTDLKNILNAIKSVPDSRKRLIAVQHCIARERGCYVITVGSEKLIVPSAYKLYIIGAAWSEYVWYGAYVAQGRLIEYLQTVKEKLEDNQTYDIRFCKIRHLYAFFIERDVNEKYNLETDCERGLCSKEEGTYLFMRSHLDIYNTRFPDVIAELRSKCSPENIENGYFDNWWGYYNADYADEITTYEAFLHEAWSASKMNSKVYNKKVQLYHCPSDKE